MTTTELVKRAERSRMRLILAVLRSRAARDADAPIGIAVLGEALPIDAPLFDHDPTDAEVPAT